MRSLAVLVLLSLAGTLLADCRARVVVTKQEVVIVKKEVVVAPAIVAVYQPVYIPLYGAGYVAPPVAAAPVPQQPVPAPQQPLPNGNANDQILQELKAIRGELQQIRGRVDALEKGKVPPNMPPPQDDPFNPKTPPQEAIKTPAANLQGLQAMKTKCAACHTKGKEAEGGGFVLLEADGSLANVSDRKVSKLLVKLARNEMPPPANKYNLPELSQEEYAAVVALFADRK